MTLSMYRASAPLIIQTLRGLSMVLAKAERFAEHRKLDESVVLDLRTFPDMFTLRRQVEMTAMHARRCMATLAGKEAPAVESELDSLKAARERVDAANDYVSGFLPEEIDGSEEREVKFQSPRGEFTFTGEQFLMNFAIPNILFHAATAFNLLRGLGVEIGKMDFVGRSTA